VDISATIEAVRGLAPRAAIAREAARLRRDELDGSLALAGSPLTRPELDALIDRGIAAGGHPLEVYVAARDLATAAAWVAEQRPLPGGDPRPLISVEEIRRLHALATAGQPARRPGVWRLAVDSPQIAVVSPPPWAVAKETTVLADRFRRPPPAAELPAWLAAFLGRFARIRPFGSANGPAGRLAAALLLRRLDVPPLALPRRRTAEYAAALLASESGDRLPLGNLIAETLLGSCRRLIAASEGQPLEPLRTLAGPHYAALIKAAQRGRLPAIERDGRIYTTAAWIAAYRAKRGDPRRQR
jgi:Fic family protein